MYNLFKKVGTHPKYILPFPSWLFSTQKNVYGTPNIPNKYVNKPQDAHEE